MPQQKPESLTHTTHSLKRKFPLRGLLAAALLPLFGMVAAYGIAPETDTRDIAIQTLVENISLPHSGKAQNSAAIEAASQAFHHEAVVLPGETLDALLNRLGVNEADSGLLLSQGAASFGRNLRANQRIQATISDQGGLIELLMASNSGELSRVSRQGVGFVLDQPPAGFSQRPAQRRQLLGCL